MVQPAAPSSTCACIVDPIVNSGPYQLISGACSAVVSLAQRIINFVSSIFAVIANFVRSCICGAAAATPPASPASTTPPAPRATGLFGAVPVPPPSVNVVEQGKEYLARLLEQYEHDYNPAELLARMRNGQAGNTWLANLLVYELVMITISLEGRPLPFMVERGIGASPLTFIASIQRLRAALAGLDQVSEFSGTEDEIARVGDAVCRLFYDRHLRNAPSDPQAPNIPMMIQ